MNSENKRADMPSKRALIAFWAGPGESIMENFGVHNWMFISNKQASCMACGFYKKVERCHIVSLCNSGSNDPQNIVFLCPTCHAESEFLEGLEFWAWLRDVNTSPRYKSIWQRAQADWEKMSPECRERVSLRAMKKLKES